MRRKGPPTYRKRLDSDTESEYIPSDSDSDYEDSETDDDTVTEDLSFLDANKIIV